MWLLQLVAAAAVALQGGTHYMELTNLNQPVRGDSNSTLLIFLGTTKT